MPREVHGSLLKGRENAHKLAAADRFEACFKEWSGTAAFTSWESEADTETASGAGQHVEIPFLDVVEMFVEVAAGEPVPKGKGEVIAFGTSINGGSADADCESVTWLLLDCDGAGDLREFVELLKMYNVAFIAQRRGVKWHIHLPFATPIVVPQPYERTWKKQHIARMEWATGIFSELAGLTLDLKAKKKVYGFDAAIPSLRVLGICYPYARRKEEDEIPETIWNDGRALDLTTLLASTDFEYSPKTGAPRTISLEESEGRHAALSAANLVREEFADGKLALICPWSTDVTPNGHEPGGQTSTIMFANGVWHCSHETCAGRGWNDIDQWLADNAPAARDEAWRSQLTHNDKGKVKASIHNVLLIFEHDPAWKGNIRYDERACRVVLTRDPPWNGDRIWGDHFITRAAGWLARRWGIEGQDLVAKGIEAVAHANAFDPVAEYLEGLKWDGVHRINTWLVRYLEAADTRLNRELGRMWLISACARGIYPGSQCDHMLVLEGKQKIGKTSTFRILGGEWYSDITTIHGTAAMERLQGMWIMEMSELAATKRGETEVLKAFITRREDMYRAAYARVSENRPRRCVFGGTTNEGEYLDDTQNRRIWPVWVKQLDFTALERDRDQLFAEAMVQVKAGALWHIVDAEVQEQVEKEQEARRYTDPWEDKIAAYLAGLSVTTMHKVMQIALGIETKDQSRHYKAVGRILGALGWVVKKIRHNGGQGRFLIRSGQDEGAIRWSDLGGPTLSVIRGGAADTASPPDTASP